MKGTERAKERAKESSFTKRAQLTLGPASVRCGMYVIDLTSLGMTGANVMKESNAGSDAGR